jgi:hypothetical protein
MNLEVINSLQKPDLFEKFKIQTIRDFELSGVQEFLPNMDSNNLDYLNQEFYNSILKLEMSNALKNLLYRIDITELQIKSAANKNPQTSMQHLLAELMIKRILQKVVLKEMYSK